MITYASKDGADGFVYTEEHVRKAPAGSTRQLRRCCCNDYWGPYRCTRESGHSGPHRAHNRQWHYDALTFLPVRSMGIIAEWFSADLWSDLEVGSWDGSVD